MPITRRTLLSCGAALAGGSAALLRGTPQQPNVLLVITDDQGYGDLGCHGNRFVRTPNIDCLHAQSVRLTNYHVSPTCAPTRAALLTGRYTNATGAWHTIMGRNFLRPGEVTLADCFRASSYRTGIFGKWHLGDNHPCRPEDRGFDEVLIHGGGGVWQTPDYFGNDYTDDTYLHNGRLRRYTGFCTDVWFENAMRFMRSAGAAGRPFFCLLATNAPHDPMWAPEAYAARYRDVPQLKEPGFFGMIENIDDNMGKLTGFLSNNRLSENTILIFTTDNGSSAGAPVHNAGMRGAKGSPYDGGHRVPFFIRWPAGGLAGGRDVGTLAAHIDVLPTLSALCNLDRPNGPPLHGRSLQPLFRDKEKEPVWPDRAILTDSQRVDQIVKWRQTAVMTQRWRLVNPSPVGDLSAVELYDMDADPGQRNNVAAANTAVVSKLIAEYEQWWSLVSPGSSEPVRISLGGPAGDQVKLTAHDWHGEGAERAWSQRAILQAPIANGFWAVDLLQPGHYRIELRRWPREVNLPINAPYTVPTGNRETMPGRSIACVRARVRICGIEQATPVSQREKAAVFRLNLPRGSSELQTWLDDADGTERGAYFVYVNRLP